MNNHQRMKCYQIPYFSSSRMEVFNNAYNFCLSIWEYNDHLRANNMSFRTLRQYQTFGLCRWGERAWSAFFTSCKTQWEISLALAEEGLHRFPGQKSIDTTGMGYDFEMVKYIVIRGDSFCIKDFLWFSYMYVYIIYVYIYIYDYRFCFAPPFFPHSLY